MRTLALDSGAFTAHSSGAPIVLEDYVEFARSLLARETRLTEVFALDVIGDAKASRRNAEAMAANGLDVVPTFHCGSPWGELDSLARSFSKIALGGAVGYSAKQAWATECFRRIWPKRVHGFGFGGERALLSLPFHSIDATNWQLGPTRFGQWHGARWGKLPGREATRDLRATVAGMLRLEARARARWRSTWAKHFPEDAE